LASIGLIKEEKAWWRPPSFAIKIFW
jgi:hypothetical protein